jgi:hypothetical protein
VGFIVLYLRKPVSEQICSLAGTCQEKIEFRAVRDQYVHVIPILACNFHITPGCASGKYCPGQIFLRLLILPLRMILCVPCVWKVAVHLGYGMYIWCIVIAHSRLMS